MEIVSITENEFDLLSSKHRLSSFYQTAQYGKLMEHTSFDVDYIKIEDKGEVIGTSLILNKTIYIGFKYGYAPRGLLIDYEKVDRIPAIIKALKGYLLRKKYMILKFDPPIIINLRDVNGEIIESNESAESIMKALKDAGLIHCGFNNYMESIKPRCVALLNLRGKEQPQLFFGLDKNIRNKLRKATKYGVEVYVDTYNDIEKIYSFIKDKGSYSEKYYEEFKKSFKENFEVYFARINTEMYVRNSSYLYEKEREINDYINSIIQSGKIKGRKMKALLNKKMDSDKILNSYKMHVVRSTALLKNNPNGLIIGGAITIKFNNRQYLLIEGYADEYNDLCPSYLTKWKIIENNCNKKIQFIDFNAISGDFSKESPYRGLNDIKLGFSSNAVEYIGEFNLITNKLAYSAYRSTADKYSIKNEQK